MKNTGHCRPLVSVINSKPVFFRCTGKGGGKIKRIGVELRKGRILAKTIRNDDTRN
jgi:hypothetical protein